MTENTFILLVFIDDERVGRHLLNYRDNGLLTVKMYEFIVFYNNRNIRRKMPGDVVLAFKTFCDMLPKEEADKCAL